MFTGIISDIGTLVDAVPLPASGARDTGMGGGMRAVIACRYDLAAIATGDSIACAGVCLSVVDTGQGADARTWFAVQISPETLARTTCGHWHRGMAVNLECAVRAGQPLGGHIVQGHVDGVGHIAACPDTADDMWSITCPPALARLIAKKGSIAVDGVSLTVNAVSEDRFALTLIPITRQRTTLGACTVGSAVNLEIDLFMRYVDRVLQTRPETAHQESASRQYAHPESGL